ncbi:Ceruloplasmin [Triplophysa tibetana]|uniref:Ceruloplasmin n=1 Tax=Triplophysa tibetana TaxID=1572043 RepID=A0A5A9NSS8_9TELE|nr:Ceruloplasmin [Triplophysa tibetana]
MKGLKLNVLLLLCYAGAVSSITREYFLAIKEIQWDYAPSGINVIQNKTIKEDEEARVFLEKGEKRIGRVYKKAVYQQYTDATYRQEIEKPKWLGYLGPLISAEEDDTIIVHMKNTATRVYSIHAHGVSYNKSSEGALYPDSSEKIEKTDDSVGPGKSFSYIWTLPVSHSPGKDDTNCLTRIYHSHVNAPKDIASGLIGPLIICKKGTLDVHGDKSADYLYALMFTVSDENLSWYLDENIKTHCSATAKVNKEDEDFQESNKMHSINGYVYGNLPDLSMCVGNKIHWHLFGMGNEVDIHSAYFHGQVLTDKSFHTDTVSLFPATFVNVEMVADNPGQWLLSCQVNDHLKAGMQAFFEIKKCFPHVHKARPFGEVRQYYIAAEEIIWDYGPTEINQYTGKKLTDDSVSDTFFDNRNDRIGGKYKKVQYVEYIDDKFTKRKERTTDEQHLGILGPIIRAEEEDTIKVSFRNKASRPYSIQPHGVQYNIEMDGTLYHNVLEETYTEKKLRELKKEARIVKPLPAAMVLPDTTYNYEWVVPKGGGPTQNDADCITYLYYSAVDPIQDTNSGLVGPLLICKPKSLKSGKQKNVNKEFHLLATVFDENLSWYLDYNINRYAKQPKSVNKDNEDFQESNKMHSLNGYMYGNLKGLNMCKGDKVSWHLSGLGSEADIHGLYFEGNRFLYKETRRDTINVFPHISHTVIMEPDSMGQFQVACKTTDHYHGGMRANYTVEKCHFWNRQSEVMLQQKKYYIAAVEMEWDYSPNRNWEEKLHNSLNNSPGNMFLKKDGKFIGSKYKKVLYREYTDETFTKPKERPADMEHLGIMGAMIHGNVGEKVKVVFKNMAKRPYSIHAHGVKTDSPQVTPTLPGKCYQVMFFVKYQTAPSPNALTCGQRILFSTKMVRKRRDIHLIHGLIIQCRRWPIHLVAERIVIKVCHQFLVLTELLDRVMDESFKTHQKHAYTILQECFEFLLNEKLHMAIGFADGGLSGSKKLVILKPFIQIFGADEELDPQGAHLHSHSYKYETLGLSHETRAEHIFVQTDDTVQILTSYYGNQCLHCCTAGILRGALTLTYHRSYKAQIPCCFVKDN